MTSTLDYHTAVTGSWKIYLGSVMGGTISVVGAAIVVACNGGKYNILWGSLFALPFCFLGSCMYVGKMSEAISWVSFVVRLYSVATFAGEAEPFAKMAFTVVMGFVADIVPVLMTAVLNISGLLPSKGPPPVDAFERATRDFLETSMICGMEAGDHRKELARRQKAMHDAMRAALPKADRGLQVSMFKMTAILDGFTAACSVKYLDPVVNRELWEPLQADLRALCSKAFRILSGTPKEVDEVGELRRSSERVKNRIKLMLMSYSKGLVRSEDWMWVASGRELSRVEAALIAVPYFAEALASYLQAKPEGLPRKSWADYVSRGKEFRD